MPSQVAYATLRLVLVGPSGLFPAGEVKRICRSSPFWAFYLRGQTNAFENGVEKFSDFSATFFIHL